KGPGGVARKKIDFTGLQRGETFRRIGRCKLYLLRIAEDRGRNSFTKIRVEALPVALIIGSSKTGETCVNAALDKAFRLDVVQSCGGAGCDRQCKRRRSDNSGYKFFHAHVPFSSYRGRSEEHTSELQSREKLVCRLLLEKKKR